MLLSLTGRAPKAQLRSGQWRLDHGGVTVLEFRQPD